MFKSDLTIEPTPIASGFFGDVHLGEDKIHGKVAVKVLKKMPGESDADWLARGIELIEEGQNLKKASHANVVQVLNVLRHEGSDAVHLVTELCDGGSLEGIYKKGPVGIAKLRDIASQVCSGLSNVHASGLIHRDVKPGNILIHRNKAKISDFGLVSDRVILGYASADGYCDHLAPEVYNDSVTSVKTDIWALGMTLYRLLHGHDFYLGYFVSKNIPDMVTRGGFAKKLPWAPHIPPEWRRLVRKAMNDDSSRRFGSAMEFSQAVARLPISPEWKWSVKGNQEVWSRNEKGRLITATLTEVSANNYEWSAIRSGGGKRSLTVGSNSEKLKSLMVAYRDLEGFFYP